MKRFAELFQALDTTTSTNAKVEALQRYFAAAPAYDVAWAVYFLAGGKPRQVVPTARLRALACVTAAACHMIAQHTATGIGHAHRAVRESFQFNAFRQAIAYSTDIVQR